MMRLESPTKIDKNQLAYFPFYKEEVLENDKDKILRKIDLERAMQLGNIYKNPVIIYFKNSMNETMMVNASIWAITAKYVQLKGGITIPITSIIRVLV